MKILSTMFTAWIGLAMPLCIHGQTFQYSISLQEVTFLNDNEEPRNANLFPIRKDDGTSYVRLGQPHWRQAVTTKIPIAYQSGTKPRVTAKFKLKCSQAIGNQVQICGKVSNPANGEETLTTFDTLDINPVSTGGANPYTYDLLYNKGSGTHFAKKIRYIENCTIQWKISFDSGGHWSVLDAANNSNVNELYVTWKKPLPESSTVYEHLHTLFHLSCKANNNFEPTTEMSVFENAWKLFDASQNRIESNSNLVRRDGHKLVYYNTYDVVFVNSYDLIQWGDGQCYAFARLLLDLCRIQGINTDDGLVEIEPNLEVLQACGGRDIQQFQAKFLVKNWNFTNPNYRVDCDKFPFIIVHDLAGITYLRNPNRYVFIYSEISDEEGIFGQNNRNPNSFFGAHAVVKFHDKIYDPSYGVSYNSIQEIPKNLSAWAYRRLNVSEEFFRSDFNRNGNTTDIFDAVFLSSDIQVNQFHPR